MDEKEKDTAELVATGGGVKIKDMDMLEFATMVVKSGIAPRGINTPGAAMMAMQAGIDREIGPMGGLQNCVVINGNLSWKGQAAVAMIVNSPVCKPGTLRFWTEGIGDEMVGIAVAHRVGYRDPERREFTVADAKKAGLWGRQGPWTQYTKRQMAWRAVGFLARDVFPDVLGGFPLAEEAQDFEPPKRRQLTVSGAGEVKPRPGKDPILEAVAVEAVSGKDAAPVSVGFICDHGVPKPEFCAECSKAADQGLFDK